MSTLTSIPTSDDSYRDHINTVDKKGKRVWIYPLFQAGKYFTWRNVVAYILLGFLIGTPFIHINHHPFFLFNIIDRRFILFGIPFWPQDFYLFALAMLTFAVGIITVTSVFGRLWCGWACPQTIFLEFLFRRIEYWIEGDAPKRRQLDKAPWNTNKIVRKTSKWFVFYLLSLFIANIFLAYVIGVDQLKAIITEPLSKHVSGFMGILIFSGVFYFVFTFMREQVCLVVCPYGRLQGVLVDQYGMAVTYDSVRGEPRSKAVTHTKDGDAVVDKAINCVDCKRCVQVCPTGIDIRNGAQLECIQCTACIDACDDIMTRLQRPTGLIRITTPMNVLKKSGFIFTRKMAGYVAVTCVLSTLLITMLALRKPVSCAVYRTPGQLYILGTDKVVSNLYNFKLLNKTFNNHTITLTVKSPADATIKMINTPSVNVASDQLNEGEFMVRIPEDDITKNRTPLVIQVWMDGKPLYTKSSVFVGPVK